MALGSNLGERLAYLRSGVAGLEDSVELEAVSSVYASRAVGYDNQPDFLNAVAVGRTELAPLELLERLLTVETGRGRRRSIPKGPRTLDLDLVFYDGLRLDTGRLVVPHPRWAHRSFVLAPLAEVVPGWTDPETGRTVLDVWRSRREELPAVRPVAGPDSIWRDVS